MKLETGDHVALGTLVGASVLTGIVYPRLPARIPTHFDLHGVADGWMTRAIGAWMLPAVGLALWGLLRFGGRLLPRPWARRQEASPTSTLGALVVGLMGALQCVVLYAALANPPTVAVGLGVVLGPFWIALGLVMPKVRRNPWMGVRTVWTLRSDENWARTHRVAGYTFVIAGLVAVLAVVIGHAGAVPLVIVGSAIVPVVYSFLLSRRLPPAT